MRGTRFAEGGSSAEGTLTIFNHPTLIELLETLRKRGPLRSLARRVLAHLSRVEPETRPVLEELDESDRRAADRATRGYEAAFAAAAARAESALRRIEEESEQAGRDLDRLLAARIGSRRDLFDRARTWYRGAAFAEKLLAETRASASRNARESLELAGVARKVCSWLSEEHYGLAFCRRLALRSEALHANALRAAGELVAADRHWWLIAERQGLAPLSDPADEAELASLEASLRFDQRRLDEAGELAARAVRLYRQAGDRVGEGRALIQQANALDEAGDPAAASRLLREALSTIDPESQPRDYLMALNNLGICLCGAGDHAAAAELVERHRRLYEQQRDAYTTPRLAVLEARIARGMGDRRSAERHLRAALNSYLGEGNGFTAALTALDLARLYIEEGRTIDVKRLAVATHRAFAEREVHPEAAESMRVFAQAAAAETVTLEILDRLQARLEAASVRPRPIPPPS